MASWVYIRPFRRGVNNADETCPAWRDAVEGLDAVFRFLVEDLLIRFGIPAAAVLLVIALPVVGLVFLIRAIVRRRKARKAAKTADQ